MYWALLYVESSYVLGPAIGWVLHICFGLCYVLGSALCWALLCVGLCYMFGPAQCRDAIVPVRTQAYSSGACVGPKALTCKYFKAMLPA